MAILLNLVKYTGGNLIRVFSFDDCDNTAAQTFSNITNDISRGCIHGMQWCVALIAG